MDPNKNLNPINVRLLTKPLKNWSVSKGLLKEASSKFVFANRKSKFRAKILYLFFNV